MIHFISGLPRSGSTLLASLLNQNPDFSAHIQSPLGQVVTTVQEAMSPNANEGAIFFSPAQRLAILRGLFSSYYAGYPDTVFDNNRRWCAHLPLLATLFPESKVIACVRPVAEVIDSFERMFLRDPTQISRIVSSPNTCLLDRVGTLMSPTGVVGFSWNALRDGYFGPGRENMALLEFRNLISNPIKALKDIHQFIGAPWFAGYDVKHVEPFLDAEEFDRSLGCEGLHRPYREVKPRAYTPVIHPSLADTFPKPFWINESVTPNE